jgi:uncharacterized protein YbcI
MQQLDSPAGAPPASPSRSPLQGIADAAARHYKEQFGRGPVRCKAHFAGRDAVLVILEGTMTPAETRLVQDGHREQVRSFRTLQQHAVQESLIAAVGAHVGRAVQQGITGIDVRGDVVTELFLLEPEDDAVTPAG